MRYSIEPTCILSPIITVLITLPLLLITRLYVCIHNCIRSVFTQTLSSPLVPYQSSPTSITRSYYYPLPLHSITLPSQPFSQFPPVIVLFPWFTNPSFSFVIALFTISSLDHVTESSDMSSNRLLQASWSRKQLHYNKIHPIYCKVVAKWAEPTCGQIYSVLLSKTYWYHYKMHQILSVKWFALKRSSNGQNHAKREQVVL